MLIGDPQEGAVGGKSGRIGVGSIERERRTWRLHARNATGSARIPEDAVSSVIDNPDVTAVGCNILRLTQSLWRPGTLQGPIRRINVDVFVGVDDPIDVSGAIAGNAPWP